MPIAAPALRPYRFSRAEYHAIAASLDPSLRYELLDGTIYAMRPAKPPHAGVVDFFLNRLRELDPAIYQLRSQAVVEIEPDGSPEPDVAVLTFRSDYYATSHPNGGDVRLVIEVGDTERNPRAKMREYTRDGRIPLSDRIEVLSPGHLPNGITVEAMQIGARASRNQLIVDTMRDYGYVERLGLGVLQMFREMQAFNGTTPGLRQVDETFVVTLAR